MDSQKQQAAERIKQANNILVTVASNPSVDQLAACIGLTLSLNKMGKHATAVFSGNVPSTIEFLQPEKTLEKNTDSLRDFIIALDKSKADKLRYKVEDRVVKIFITPYKTSISEKDLEFSQGDFNVDVVLALGVHNQADLDQAITAHGRILHDATIITMNIQPGGELGSINWLDPGASSLSELAVQLVDTLDKKLIDGQVATAFLTGIVAETERFSNSKTTPQTMSASAELMAADANQQLVATKLEEPAPVPAAPLAQQGEADKVTEGGQAPPAKKPDDGTLEIAHEDTPAPETSVEASEADTEQPQPAAAAPEEAPEEPAAPVTPQIHIDEHGALYPAENTDTEAGMLPPVSHEMPTISHHDEPPAMVTQPPTLGGSLNATAATSFGQSDESAVPGLPLEEAPLPPSMENDNPSVGPTIVPPNTPVEEEQNAPGTTFLGDQLIEPTSSSEGIGSPLVESPEESTGDADTTANKTLSDIEHDVHSKHLTEPSMPAVNDTPSPLNPFVSANDPVLPPVPGTPPPAPVWSPDSSPTPSDASPVATDTASESHADSDAANVDSARDAVAQALSEGPAPAPGPIEALNAQPVHLSLGNDGVSNQDAVQPAPPIQPWTPPADDSAADNPSTSDFGTSQDQSTDQNNDPNAPPPVPPPIPIVPPSS